MIDNQKAITDRIRQLRDEKGLRNSDLAEACDVSLQAVGQWLKTARIHRKHFPRLASLFGVSIQYLLTGDEPSTVEIESIQEERLIQAFRGLPPEKRDELIRDLDKAEQALKGALKKLHSREVS